VVNNHQYWESYLHKCVHQFGELVLQGTLATSFLKCGEYSFFDIDALSNGIPNRSNLL
jgi:hypothetical protein